MSKQWYCLKVDQRQGPFTASELKAQVASGALQASDLIWRRGAAAWVQAGWIKELGFAPSCRSKDLSDPER